MQWPMCCTVSAAGLHRVTVIEVTRLLLPHQHFAACKDIAQKFGKQDLFLLGHRTIPSTETFSYCNRFDEQSADQEQQLSVAGTDPPL